METPFAVRSNLCTSIYTDTHEVVVPKLGATASSSLSGGGGAVTIVAIQSGRWGPSAPLP